MRSESKEAAPREESGLFALNRREAEELQIHKCLLRIRNVFRC